jgi:hypothetical protein
MIVEFFPRLKLKSFQVDKDHTNVSLTKNAGHSIFLFGSMSMSQILLKHKFIFNTLGLTNYMPPYSSEGFNEKSEENVFKYEERSALSREITKL